MTNGKHTSIFTIYTIFKDKLIILMNYLHDRFALKVKYVVYFW